MMQEQMFLAEFKITCMMSISVAQSRILQDQYLAELKIAEVGTSTVLENLKTFKKEWFYAESFKSMQEQVFSAKFQTMKKAVILAECRNSVSFAPESKIVQEPW